MQKNTLKSGIQISELGLGCMSLGTDFKKAEAIIHTALENGITYFDTADIYDKGVNEEIVGKALKPFQQRNDLIIGTKVGNHLKSNGDMFWDPSKKYIKENVKSSLKRLGLDQLDLYMLHGGTIDDPLDETISAFDELKQEGLIKSYGLSSIRPNVIRYYLKHSQIETIMSQFNLIDNRPEMLLEEINQHEVKVLARGPLFKGLLTQKSEKVLSQKFEDGIFDYDYDELKDTILELREKDTHLSALTFGYLKRFNALGSVIVGASDVNQLKENITHFNQDVDSHTIDAARKIVKTLKYTQHLD
ncbi:aldo/keto reductase [Staphylococcus felis]|uniref:aldo/keto reductase n=1 Tax=Staphylococcus felis TaxID=46127 RepID=UPI0021D29DBA|nr:aldo/keto reductase [Staphylococcus felis]UXR85748.1 aldo/keto reductase [Staphylococcus felis]